MTPVLYYTCLNCCCVFVHCDLPSSADSPRLCQCTSWVSSLCPNHGEVIACVTSTQQSKTTCSLSAVLSPCCVVFSQCCAVTLFCGVLSVLCRHPVLWCLLGHSDLVVVCLSHGLQDERAKYTSPDELSIQYEVPVTNPEVRGHMTVM